MGAKFENVVLNIKKLQQIKKEIGVDYPKVRIQTVLLPELIPTIEGYKKFWLDVVDEIGFLDYQPRVEEMPRAYIIILCDKKTSRTPNHDAGIAAMGISMVAYDEGLGSCILGAVDREKLREIWKVPEGLAIVLVVALGYPAENPVVDTMKAGDIKYWLDEKEVLHVPKRDLKDVVIWNRYQNP